MTETEFKLFDVVRLKADVSDAHLKAGQRGTIIELWPDGRFEIEFFEDPTPEDTYLKNVILYSASASEIEIDDW